MSRRDLPRGGPQLPHVLLQKLGVDEPASQRARGSRKPVRTGSRKEQRKEERAQRGAVKASRYKQRASKVSQADVDDEEPLANSSIQGEVKNISRGQQSIDRPRMRLIANRASHIRRSISPAEVSEIGSRASSPGLVLDSSSRAFKERAAQDDDEILALEKKLRVKMKKLPKSFDEDGLGDLLEGLDSDDESKKRKREGEDWLEHKRRRAQHHEEEHGEGTPSVEREDILSEFLGDLSPFEDSNDKSEFASFSDEEESGIAAPVQPRKRENPYIAPSTGPAASPAKYVPPSMRKAQDCDTEALRRIRRQVQGHLNKLSEANLVSILNEIETMYQSHARQDITSNLVDLLLALFSNRSSLQSTFVILHASFVAAIYKIIGVDFGAEFVSKLVERLDSYADVKYESTSKESNNLVSLLSYLFTFNVIGSTLVFDYLRSYLEDLNETNTELILRVVRDCGPQLRQDDPSSLKMVVQLMQIASTKIAASGKEISVRTKFMIETITDLKNNKMRAATNTAGIASEHITQMRKVLGSLNGRKIKGSEPLRIGREDIRNSDKKGKWWLVGASWKGNVREEDSVARPDIRHSGTVEQDSDTEHADLMTLARQYRMNTDVRRSIFVSVMSAADHQDAHTRLLKLRLKQAQRQEIPKVLLRCAGAETVYNPYYTIIAMKTCSEKKMKTAFQFAIWDFFKQLGERGDEDESNGENSGGEVELSEIVNLAKMYADLVIDGALSLGVLKVLNLATLKEQAQMFLEVMLLTMMTGSTWRGLPSEKDLVNAFSKSADSPQLVKPLEYFIKKKMRKSDLVAKKDREALKRGCAIATDTLAMLETPSLVLA